MKLGVFFLKFVIVSTLLISVLASAKASAAEHTIVIENMAFAPTELTVQAGDKITWMNKDLVPHTVTATNKRFDSKLIEPGKSWSYRAQKKGSISYKCSFHPTMNAKLVVQ
jgi:plastocyanin